MVGKMRHKLDLQRNVGRDLPLDDHGEITDKWQTFATVYGEVMDLSGREYWLAKQVQSDCTAKVRLHYSSQTTRLKEADRILMVDDDRGNSDRVRILHLTERPRDPDGRRLLLEVVVKEVPA